MKDLNLGSQVSEQKSVENLKPQKYHHGIHKILQLRVPSVSGPVDDNIIIGGRIWHKDEIE